MWLPCRDYSKPEARDKVRVPLQVALSSKPEDVEAREDVMLNASERNIESKDNKEKWSTVHTRLGRFVKLPVMYMNEYGSDGVECASITIHQNCVN